MDKRIKIVFGASITTMLLMLVGQAYWLYNQYQYSVTAISDEMKQTCTKLIQQEQIARHDKASKKWHDISKKDTLRLEVHIDIHKKSFGDIKSQTTFTYNLIDGTKRRIRTQDMDTQDGNAIYSRYQASLYQPFQKQSIDTLLAAHGYDTTYGFRRLSGMKIVLQPQYSTTGGWSKGLHVKYCSNPMFQQGVEFTIPIPTLEVLRLMKWQLALSLIMIIALAFCLYYQVKTIVIQKRIDGLRREFLKNMILESKQPHDEETADDCLRIGDTEFRYGLNELRHGNERVMLTSRQAEILRLLVATPNETVARERILQEAWGDDSYSNSLALNVQISYLRRAIRSDSRLSIDVIYKKGYVLNVS